MLHVEVPAGNLSIFRPSPTTGSTWSPRGIPCAEGCLRTGRAPFSSFGSGRLLCRSCKKVTGLDVGMLIFHVPRPWGNLHSADCAKLDMALNSECLEASLPQPGQLADAARLLNSGESV